MRALFKQLLTTAPLVHPQPGLRDQVWRVKYCLRGLARARLTREWFRLLRNPRLELVARAYPHILSKLQRPYLNRALGARQRLDALKSHYAFVLQRFPEKMLREVYASPGFLLASIPLEEIGQFSLRLAYCHSLGKEGDLTIKLNDEGCGFPVSALTFSAILNSDGRPEAHVGGLQGFAAGYDKARVISITRRMYGLRPKALLLFSLQQLAAVWGLAGIRAVSDNMHIYRHYLRRKELAARYDEFWLESGGQLAPDGMFDLPRTPIQRPAATVKRSKRAMYKHRYAMLAEIAGQIQSRIASLSPIKPSTPLLWLPDCPVPAPPACNACDPVPGLDPHPVANHA